MNGLTDDLRNVQHEVEEVDELNLKSLISEVNEGTPCTIDKILHGPLDALISRVRDTSTLTQKGREFLERYGDTPYYLIECHTMKGDDVKLLLRASYNPSSNFYKLGMKYGTLKPGVQIDVIFNPQKGRFDFKL